MTIHAVADLNGVRVWRNDAGWHAADQTTGELVREAITDFDAPSYSPDPVAPEVEYLIEYFGTGLFRVVYQRDITPSGGRGEDDPDVVY